MQTQIENHQAPIRAAVTTYQSGGAQSAYSEFQAFVNRTALTSQGEFTERFRIDSFDGTFISASLEFQMQRIVHRIQYLLPLDDLDGSAISAFADEIGSQNFTLRIPCRDGATFQFYRPDQGRGGFTDRIDIMFRDHRTVLRARDLLVAALQARSANE